MAAFIVQQQQQQQQQHIQAHPSHDLHHTLEAINHGSHRTDIETAAPSHPDRGFSLMPLFHGDTFISAFTAVVTEYMESGVLFSTLAIGLISAVFGFIILGIYSSDRVYDLLQPDEVAFMFRQFDLLVALVIANRVSELRTHFSNLTARFGNMVTRVYALSYTIESIARSRRSITLHDEGVSPLLELDEPDKASADEAARNLAVRLWVRNMLSLVYLAGVSVYHLFIGISVNETRTYFVNQMGDEVVTKDHLKILHKIESPTEFSRQVTMQLNSRVYQGLKDEIITEVEARDVRETVAAIEEFISSMEVSMHITTPTVASVPDYILMTTYLLIVIPINVYNGVGALIPMFLPIFGIVYGTYLTTTWWLGSPSAMGRKRHSGIDFKSRRQVMMRKLETQHARTMDYLGGKVHQEEVDRARKKLSEGWSV